MKIFGEPSNKFEYDSQTEKQDNATNNSWATEIESFFFVNHLKWLNFNAHIKIDIV